MGLLQHSPRRITKPYAAFCETKKSRALKPPPKVANSGGPVPVARSRWPGPGSRWPVPLARSGGPVPVAVPVARSRWPGPGGPVPVDRSRWPGPGGPVPVARSRSRGPVRWPGPGSALRVRARGPARKKTYSGVITCKRICSNLPL